MSFLTRIKMANRSLFIMSGIVLASAFYYFMFDNGGNLEVTYNNMIAELKKSQESLDGTNAVLQDYGRFQAEFQMVSDQFQAALEYLPESFNTQDLLKQISDESRAAGVTLVAVKPKPSETREFYEELAMDVELEGPFSLLTTFLAYMSKQNRIVNIKNIEIEFKQIVDSVPRLTMKGTLVSYRYKKVANATPPPIPSPVKK
ncbi:MAG: type 4a pilus biogenesis protein PilO [Bdellovibrionales bacterium]